MSDNDNAEHTDKPIKKETYTAEEKKMIMDRLDAERRAHDQAMKGLGNHKTVYTQNEKNKILDKLNEQRLSRQKREEIEKRRVENKEVYKLGSKYYYKFIKMEREYYIELEDIKKVSTRPTLITLTYKTFDELKKKDVLMKTEVYSDKFFISKDAIRVYYKTYALEDAKKK
jgi:predicted Fe-S protein YdhL (DUF1289 family)